MYKTGFLILTCVLALAACAKKPADSYTAYYPECRQPILDMESRPSAASGALKGGVGGGIVGGASGFFLGLLLHSGNLANAGISAAVGAATGAVTGGIAGGVSSAGSPDEARDNALLARYYEQIDGDISGLTLRQAAGTVAMQCYRKKLAQVDAEVAAGTLDTAAAQKRREEIDLGMHEATQLVGQQSGNPDEQQKEG